MTKIVYLLSFLTVFTCSLDSSEDAIKSLNPPKWIRGTWHTENAYITDWIFTKNDVKNVIHGKAVSMKDEAGDYDVSDSYTENTYTINMGFIKYTFIKEDNNSITVNGDTYLKIN